MTSQNLRSTAPSGASPFVDDLIVGLKRWDLWRTFALDDIQQRYRRSALGLLWIVLSYLLFVGGITVVFSVFSTSGSTDFVIHVAVGYAAFMFIISNFNDGCDVFVRSATWIKSVSMPYSTYVYRSIFRTGFSFVIQLSMALIIMIFLGWRPGPLVALAVPALVAYVFNAVAVQYLAGLIGARYRDFTHFVSSITRLMFFVTPVLWVASDLPGTRSFIADYNPLAHYLNVLRAPLMNTPPSGVSWLVVATTTLLLWVILFLGAARMRRRLAYWI